MTDGTGKKQITAYISTMGCPKNRVDSEAAAGVLQRAGCEITGDPSEADVLLVGSCSFLQSAWSDTVDELGRLASFKNGAGKRLVLMGCLPLHREIDLAAELPEVDHFVPTGAHARLEELARLWNSVPEGVIAAAPRQVDGRGVDRFAAFAGRPLTTPPHRAYVKVAEGCNRRCSFCAIPKIRGRHEMRPVPDIVGEVEGLVDRGVR
ncbi:MAG: radical SAM protein, partial [Candidatus Latescibacterota bacterium]